jgi:hypothetical protein
MIKALFCLTAILFFNYAFTQVPAMVWQKTFGGTGDEYAYSMKLANDGGYIVCGYTDSDDGDISDNHGNVDAWVIKLNKAGEIAWQKVFGGSGNDEGLCIQPTSDGGYIMCAYTESADGDINTNHGLGDMLVVKLAATGATEWKRTFGGSELDFVTSIIQTANGDYVFAGYTESADFDVISNHGGRDTWVVKLNPMGDIIWRKTFGGTYDDHIEQIIETSDHSLMAAGVTESTDGDAVGANSEKGGGAWLLKLDEAGTLLWQKDYGGNMEDLFFCIEKTIDGGYILGGCSASSDGGVPENKGYRDAWFVKIDDVGNPQWQRTFGGTGADEIYNVQQTNDGGYIASCYSNSNDGDIVGNRGMADYWLIKLDPSGTLQWQQTLGGTGEDHISSILQTGDGGYIVAGDSDSNDGDVAGNHGSNDVWIIRLAVSDPAILCPPVASTQLSNSSAGTSYQWQVNKGAGFENILSADTYYNNEHTATLQLVDIPSAWAHYQYRCVVDGNNTDTITIKFVNTWAGGASGDWENLSNWGCGVIPDANTDVVISNGHIIINSNAICRSLTVNPGATITVKPGFKLTVTH